MGHGGGSHSRCWEGIAEWVLGEGTQWVLGGDHMVGARGRSHGGCQEGITR